MIHMNPMVQGNIRASTRRKSSSTRAISGPAASFSKRKSRLGSRMRSKSVKESRQQFDSHQFDSFSDIPERPLIPKKTSRSFLGPPSQNNKRIPKITFKAHSVEYDQTTEVHTVQVTTGNTFVRHIPSENRDLQLQIHLLGTSYLKIVTYNCK